MVASLLIACVGSFIGASSGEFPYDSDSFFDIVRNPTKESVKDLLEALKGLNGKRLAMRTAGNNQVPLEVVSWEFNTSSPEKKTLYKQLFKELLRTVEFKTLASLSLPNPMPQELVALAQAYTIELFNEACSAIAQKNTQQLEALLTQAPQLVTEKLVGRKSLIKEAFERCFCHDSESLKIFAILADTAQTIHGNSQIDDELDPTIAQAFAEALEAVNAHDVRRLAQVITQNPYLLVIRNPYTHNTLSHLAFDAYSAKEPSSVQLFVHIMRSGVDVSLKAGMHQERPSVDSLASQEGCALQRVYKFEKEAREAATLEKSVTDIARNAKDHSIKLGELLITYKQHIAVGMILLLGSAYLIKSSSKAPRLQPVLSAAHVGQLQ